MMDDRLHEIEERLAEAVKVLTPIRVQLVLFDTGRLIQWLREASEENARLAHALERTEWDKEQAEQSADLARNAAQRLRDENVGLQGQIERLTPDLHHAEAARERAEKAADFWNLRYEQAWHEAHPIKQATTP